MFVQIFIAVIAVTTTSCCGEAVAESFVDGTVAVSEVCRDRYDFCSDYSKQGHCSLNAGWMTVNCPISCNSCELRDPAVRCTREFLNISSAPAFLEGDLNVFFDSLRGEYDALYGVEILSDDPWVVTFDNFLSDDEAAALIARQTHWQRSTETGSANVFGETGRVTGAARTSSNSWCFSECASDPAVARVISRMEAVTGLPRTMHEDLQVLKYDVGQRYTRHHDHAAVDSTRPAGARALTFFLYLSDVESGGETDFPELGIRVTPRRGKALLWANTLDSAPQEMDQRTYHQALPVKKGIKYAANAWIHLYDYQKADMWGCTGTMPG